jgi:PAS domain S-box-containing protein
MFIEDRERDLSGHSRESSGADTLLADSYRNNMDSSELFRLLEFSINRSAEMMLFFTKDLHMYYANAAVSRQLGCPTDELLAVIVDPLHPDITPEKWEELWVSAKKNGHIVRTSTLKTKDERLMPAHIHVYWFGSDGSEYLCCFIRGIDDKEKVEDGLGLYRLLAESAEDFIYIIDRNLVVKYVNRCAAEYICKAPTDVIGKPLEKFFKSDTYALIKNDILKAFISEKPVSNDSVVMDKGEGRVFNAKLVPIIEKGHVTYVMGITRDITGLKNAEKALRRSQIDMIKAQAIAHMGNWEWNLADNGIRCSDEVYRIFGYAPREFKATYDHIFLRVHPDDREYLKNTILNSVEQKKPCKAKFRAVWPDGTVRHIRSEAEAVTDADGNVIKMFGVCQDITERRKASERRSFLAAIVESSSDAIIGKTLEGTITSWNKGAERIYGYSADEVLDRPISILVPKDRTDEIPGILERIRNGELVDNFETTRLRNDGNKIDISLTVSPIKNSRGEIIGASTIARDVTGHKQLKSSLMKSERDYRELVDLAQEGIWAIDDREYTIYVNQRMADMLGYTVDKMIHKQIFNFMDKQGKVLARKHVEKRKLGVKEVFDFEFIKKDGSKIYTLMNSAPLINEYGGYGGSVAFVTDITNRRIAEKALEDAKKQSDLYLDLMVRDINSMSQTGKRYLKLALHMQILDDDSKSVIQKSLSEFENSSKLIENVKKLQKVKSGKIPPIEMDLHQVLSDVQSHYARTPDIKIKINHKPVNSCIVQADEMLYDVFYSLLDYSIERSIKVPSISISVKKMSDDERIYYAVAIEDNSPGMPGEMKSHIFNRYLKSSSDINGANIGLYLAKTLVESYHGQISVDNRVKGSPEKGNRFMVLLPVANN